jgi:hypothetical protein
MTGNEDTHNKEAFWTSGKCKLLTRLDGLDTAMGPLWSDVNMKALRPGLSPCGSLEGLLELESLLCCSLDTGSWTCSSAWI